MSAKAVYNNQSVMIYITGEHARLLLEHGEVEADCYIGPQMIRPGGCSVILLPGPADEFTSLRRAERGAIATVRSELIAAHPEAAGARNRGRYERRKRAKRTTSPNVPD